MTFLATPAERNAPPTSPSRKISLLAVGVLAILVGVIGLLAALDVVQPGREPGPPVAMRFDPAVLDGTVVAGYLRENGMAGRSRAVVVHFHDPDCPCATLADARFLALKTRHVGDDVVFAVVEPAHGTERPARGLERLPRLPADAGARLWPALPATPAIAVFDGEGRPIYLGPYADGPTCSTAHGGAVDAVLANLLSGRGSAWQAMTTSGCVCPASRPGLGGEPAVR